MVFAIWDGVTVVMSVKFLSVICCYFQDGSLNINRVLQKSGLSQWPYLSKSVGPPWSLKLYFCCNF